YVELRVRAAAPPRQDPSACGRAAPPPLWPDGIDRPVTQSWFSSRSHRTIKEYLVFSLRRFPARARLADRRFQLRGLGDHGRFGALKEFDQERELLVVVSRHVRSHRSLQRTEQRNDAAFGGGQRLDDDLAAIDRIVPPSCKTCPFQTVDHSRDRARA